eukprot:2767203-Prymnesium_polylepis.1
MHSQHTGDCVLTIKRTESGRPNKHNNTDTGDRGLVTGQWKLVITIPNIHAERGIDVSCRLCGCGPNNTRQYEAAANRSRANKACGT